MELALKMFTSQGIELQVDPSVKEYMQKYGYQVEYGARPIKRLIKQHILAPVAKHLLMHPDHSHIRIHEEQGDLVISSEA